MLRHAPAVLVGRAVRTAARLRRAGGGSAVPGLVVNRIAPGFLGSVLSSFPDGLVVVSGSAGKSTTTKLLVAVLEAHGARVFTNPSTANISQGLTSALLERASISGRIDADLAVLEMDEGHGARLAARFASRVVVLTNLVVDQVDRFHDVRQVQGMLARIAATATEALVLDAAEPLLVEIASGVRAPVRAFGPAGSGAETEAGEVSGRDAVLTVAGERAPVVLPARGAHYALDAAAAVSAAPPVFGRGEIVTVRGQQVEFVLVQNTASLALNVAELDEGLDQVMVAMGSDVRDPSYFWPADVRRLGRVRVASGSKAEEFALQLVYQGVVVERVEPDLPAALDAFLALPAPSRGVKTIVFTADSMRRTRSHLGLAS